MKHLHYDVIVVGAGIAGLTTAAYCSLENHSVLLLEKENHCGGLLGAFELDGHILDKGARSIIDSGIVFPMLKQLNIEVDFLENPIQMTIENESVVFSRENTLSSIDEYGVMLKKLYPNHQKDVDRILLDIKQVMKYMDVLYGIENPLFLPKPYDLHYVSKTLLPWMVRFMVNIRKAMKLMEPINNHLRKLTNNEELINIITQHFFAQTPTFFGLSYFTLYMQYYYPKGSTQTIVNQLLSCIKDNRGVIANHQEIVSLNTESKTMVTQDGQTYTYDQCVWAADTNNFYSTIDLEAIKSTSLKEQVTKKKALFATSKGADSVFTVYLLVNQPPSSFISASGPHGFYTALKQGLTSISIQEIQDSNKNFIKDKEFLMDWIARYIAHNTLEISIPSLRDASLSPQGQTGLIVSVLFDYKLTKHISDCGYYEEFKKHVTQCCIQLLDQGYMKDISKHILKKVVATPLTIAAKTNNTEGSLTGWSFENKPFPVIYEFLKVSKSVLTPFNSIKQAGQWAFNPAGVPVAILTGKLAADAVIKDLKKSKKRRSSHE